MVMVMVMIDVIDYLNTFSSIKPAEIYFTFNQLLHLICKNNVQNGKKSKSPVKKLQCIRVSSLSNTKGNVNFEN